MDNYHKCLWIVFKHHPNYPSYLFDLHTNQTIYPSLGGHNLSIFEGKDTNWHN